VLSFVVCSIEPAKFEAVSASLGSAAGGEPFEIVGIHDARSLCDGWTSGLARSRGDPVVFCHDDIAVHAPGLPARLSRHLARFDVIGVAGTRRCVGMDWSEAGIEHAQGAIVHDAGEGARFCFYGADAPDGEDAVAGLQALDGVFLAVRREVAASVGFDADTFDGWHGYDADFTLRAHLASHALAVALDVPLVHRSAGRIDPARERYQRRFAEKHRGVLAEGRGPWVDLREPIGLPEGIAAAFARHRLARLHEASRAEATRLDAVAARPFAAGRNDPCPCGSGLRYRECHGAARR